MVGDIIADSRATSPGIRILVQRRRDKRAAKRLLRKLLKKQMRPARVMITDKLALRRQKGRSCPASSIASTRH